MLKDILAVLGELFPLALHMVCGRMVIEQARTVSGPKSCCFSYHIQLQFQSQFHNICFVLVTTVHTASVYSGVRQCR